MFQSKKPEREDDVGDSEGVQALQRGGGHREAMDDSLQAQSLSLTASIDCYENG
jgi:hypothetical protein